MNSKEKIVANADAERRPWKAPGVRRLSTSGAESSAAGNFDASEQLS